jgi:hypothetical protein
MTQLWAPKWTSKNHTDGVTSHLIWDNLLPALFRSRRECREFIEHKYGYIRNRPDLQREPHGWKMPRPVKVTITELTIG